MLRQESRRPPVAGAHALPHQHGLNKVRLGEERKSLQVGLLDVDEADGALWCRTGGRTRFRVSAGPAALRLPRRTGSVQERRVARVVQTDVFEADDLREQACTCCWPRRHTRSDLRLRRGRFSRAEPYHHSCQSAAASLCFSSQAMRWCASADCRRSRAPRSRRAARAVARTAGAAQGKRRRCPREAKQQSRATAPRLRATCRRCARPPPGARCGARTETPTSRGRATFQAQASRLRHAHEW